MIRYLLLLLLAAFASPASAASFPPLQWAAPPLVDPTTIQLPAGPSNTWMNKSKDYIVKLPAVRKVGYTILSGGHNVVIQGGEMSLPKDDTTHRVLYIANATGTVHIEGVKISNPFSVQQDDVAVNAPLAIVQIQRSWLGPVYGWYAKWHGDLIQPWGGVLALRVADVTGISAYQGLQMSGLTGPVGSLDIRRINFTGSGTQVWGDGKDGGNGGYLFWGECGATYSVNLQDAYLKPRAVRGPSLAVYPDRGSKCPAKVSADGKRVSMVKPVAAGDWIIGSPPGGDFAPADQVGLNYKP